MESFIKAEPSTCIMEQTSEEVYDNGVASAIVTRTEVPPLGDREGYTKEVLTIQLKTLPYNISFGLSMNMDTAEALQVVLDLALAERQDLD